MRQLTIQLVTWNSAGALSRSLPTLQQVDPSIASIRVIDNASADDSVALVKQALPHAAVVQLSRNTGFAGGHNEGFRHCTTPFVLILNPDVELVAKNLPALLTSMQDSRVAAVQGKLYRESDVIDSAGVVLTRALNGRERGAGERDTGQFNDRQYVDAVTGACALYRISALHAVARARHEIFDTDFWAYKEDVDLSWRLRRAGWKILYLPVTAGIHERSLKAEGAFGWSLTASGLRRRLRDPRTAFSARNWVWTILKNATAFEVLRHSPWIAGRGALLVGMSLVYWPLLKTWVQTARGIPTMVAKRHISI